MGEDVQLCREGEGHPFFIKLFKEGVALDVVHEEVGSILIALLD
jgi:hypothetical protein